MLLVLVFLLSDCVSIDIELQMPDETVKPMLTGEDCVSIILGFGLGTVRMREAMQTQPIVERQTAYGSVRERQKVTTIRHVHSMMLKEETAFVMGRRCLVVTGEP